MNTKLINIIDHLLIEFTNQSNELWKFANSAFTNDGRGILVCVVQRKCLLNDKFKPSLEYVLQEEARKFQDVNIDKLIEAYDVTQQFVILVSILLNKIDKNGNDSILKVQIIEKFANKEIPKVYNKSGQEIKGNVSIEDIHPKLSCANCDSSTNNLKICSQCKAVVYCSTKCQKKNWKLHKTACLKFK